MTKIIEIFTNDEYGIEVHITKGRTGFHVTLIDSDADESVSTIICGNLADALKKGEIIADLPNNVNA